MNTLLDVRELGPASVTKAKWFLNMIGDAGAACRFQKGLPGVDIAPLNGIDGPFAGMVVPNITRWSVNLSIKSIFWR